MTDQTTTSAEPSTNYVRVARREGLEPTRIGEIDLLCVSGTGGSLQLNNSVEIDAGVDEQLADTLAQAVVSVSEEVRQNFEIPPRILTFHTADRVLAEAFDRRGAVARAWES
jgi:hypothetical protein